jgi:hypothetical protein
LTVVLAGFDTTKLWSRDPTVVLAGFDTTKLWSRDLTVVLAGFDTTKVLVQKADRRPQRVRHDKSSGPETRPSSSAGSTQRDSGPET